MWSMVQFIPTVNGSYIYIYASSYRWGFIEEPRVDDQQFFDQQSNGMWYYQYRQTSNISRTLVGNKIVDHSDVLGESPVAAASTTSSFSTEYLASMVWAKTTARRDEQHLIFWIWCALYQMFDGRYDTNNQQKCITCVTGHFVPQGPAYFRSIPHCAAVIYEKVEFP